MTDGVQIFLLEPQCGGRDKPWMLTGKAHPGSQWSGIMLLSY